MQLNIIPNLITLMRLLLVLPVAITILRNQLGWTLALFAVASISDGLDGFLARQFNWTSRFGAILDPIADKLMLVVTFVLLSFTHHIPQYLAAVVIARDLIIMTGAAIYHILYGAYDFAPTFLGKLSTSLQFTLVLLTLVNLSLIEIPAMLISLGIWAVFLVSSISGLDYVLTWSRKAIEAGKPTDGE